MCRCRGRALPGQKIFSIEPSVLYVKAVEKRGGSFGLGDVASDAGGGLCADLHGKRIPGQ